MTGAPAPDTVRFGVVGTGGIAARFTRDVGLLAGVDVVAVGSRTTGAAERFAAEHGVPRAHGNYVDLVHDRAVDVVYVATPHPGHESVALQAVDAGKAVLVEKPFTMDAVGAERIVAAARARGTFAMEAMWARFNPHMVRLREVVASGELGEIVTVLADHGQWFAHDPAHRLFARELGGGALLDLGIYPVSFASMVLGPPDRVTARSTSTTTGVDAQTSLLLEHANGAHAVLTCTLRGRSPTRAVVVGTDGYLEVDPRFYGATGFTVVPRSGHPWRYDEPPDGQGLRHEAAEVARCLRAGLTESPIMTLDETVQIMRTMDEVRRQTGLRYASDDAAVSPRAPEDGEPDPAPPRAAPPG